MDRGRSGNDHVRQRDNAALVWAIAWGLSISETAAGRLLAIPGIYEVLSEEYNNDAIDRLAWLAEDTTDGETTYAGGAA